MGHDFAKLGRKTHCIWGVVAPNVKLVVISNFDTRCHYKNSSHTGPLNVLNILTSRKLDTCHQLLRIM